MLAEGMLVCLTPLLSYLNGRQSDITEILAFGVNNKQTDLKKGLLHYCIFLTTDTCLTADPGVASLIPAQCHTFDHEIVSTAILLPSTDSRRVVVSYKRESLYEVLVNRLEKLTQEKNAVSELTLPTWP